MIGRLVFIPYVLLPCVLGVAAVHAQDVPGIEICTAEKTMERRTSCLQSNVEFLQKTIVKLDLEHRQKLEAAGARIEALKANLAALQRIVGDLQNAEQKTAGELKKKTDAPPLKDEAAKDRSAK